MRAVAERESMSAQRSGDATDRVGSVTDALNYIHAGAYDPVRRKAAFRVRALAWWVRNGRTREFSSEMKERG